MDNTTGTFEIKKKIFLQGDFSGKYEANQFATLSNCNLSNINILEGKLDNVQRCDFNSLFNIKSESLHHQDGFNVELKLDDELLNDRYVFIEEFNNSTIYDITLSDHQIDDNDTFGVIEGKMICALEDTCEFDFSENENTYTITKEINFGDSTFSPIKIVSNFSKWTLRPFKRSFNFIKSKLFSFNKK